MKITDIYKEKFVEKIREMNPVFYLLHKDVEKWVAMDWELWGKITSVFSRILYG